MGIITCIPGKCEQCWCLCPLPLTHHGKNVHKVLGAPPTSDFLSLVYLLICVTVTEGSVQANESSQICPGISDVFAQALRSHFGCGLWGSSAHPSCRAGLWWHRGHGESFAHATNFSESQRWSLCSCGGVGGGLGHLPWCQTTNALLGSLGLCSGGTFGPAVPGRQMWRYRGGEVTRVSWVTAVLWPLAVSFAGCCPNRKANYFVYAGPITSARSAFVCL